MPSVDLYKKLNKIYVLICNKLWSLHVYICNIVKS